MRERERNYLILKIDFNHLLRIQVYVKTLASQIVYCVVLVMINLFINKRI